MTLSGNRDGPQPSLDKFVTWSGGGLAELLECCSKCAPSPMAVLEIVLSRDPVRTAGASAFGLTTGRVRSTSGLKALASRSSKSWPGLAVSYSQDLMNQKKPDATKAPRRGPTQ